MQKSKKKKGLALKKNRPRKTFLKLESSSEEDVGNCNESDEEPGTMEAVLWDIEMEEEEKKQEDMLINQTVFVSIFVLIKLQGKKHKVLCCRSC